MKNTVWILLDTETTGLRAPIYAVEIAAQRMVGWQRYGKPFQVLLNHDVPIDPQAEALHGYSQEYLRRHGRDPREAHDMFRTYVDGAPVVSHNLGFDWDRVLEPEFEWLRVKPAGRRGFCALTLARRLVHETKSYRLESLAARFCPDAKVSHRAADDLSVLVHLCENVYGPRLTSAGFENFEDVAGFSRRTPVAECLRLIFPNGFGQPKTVVHAHLRPMPVEAPAVPTETALLAAAKNLREFCRGLVADNVMNPKEFVALYEWLENSPYTDQYPLSQIAHLVERIVADGVVTPDELAELKLALDEFIAT